MHATQSQGTGERGHSEKLQLGDHHGVENSLCERMRRGRSQGRRRRLSCGQAQRHLNRGVKQHQGNWLDRDSGRQRDVVGREARGASAPAQLITSSRQPAAHGSDRPAELTGGLVMGQPLEIAQHHRARSSSGMPGQFLVQNWAQFALLAFADGRADVASFLMYTNLLQDPPPTSVGTRRTATR